MLRFQQEARAVAALSHPNIITVFDFGTTPYPYLVMDFLEGYTLSQILEVRKDRILPYQEAVALFTQICDGLHHAHKRGIVHRDLKPANIMIVQDEEYRPLVKILDFGLARLMPDRFEGAPQLTQPGTVFGTLQYMSPEQCMGSAIDARSDIFSLGCIMYETITGMPAVQGNNFMEVCKHHLSGAAPLRFDTIFPRGRNTPPRALEKLIFKALSSNPDERQESVLQVKAELFDAIGSARTPLRPMQDHPAPDRAGHDHTLAAEASQVNTNSRRAVDEREQKLLRRLEEAEQEYGLGSDSVAHCLEALAGHYKELELFELAEEFYNKTLTMILAKYGNHSLWAAHLNEELGFVYSMLKNGEQAVQSFSNARDAYEAAKGEPDLNVACMEYFLYQTYVLDVNSSGGQAIDALKRSLHILETYCPDETERLIDWNTDAAKFYQWLMIDDLAEFHYTQALSFAEKAYSEKDERLIDPLLCLAEFYYVVGQCEKAEPLYRRATNIAYKTLNKLDNRLAATLYKSGTFYYRFGDYAKAKKCLQTTLSIDEQNRGPNCLEHISTLEYLALISGKEGDSRTTEQLLVRAVAIAEEHSGPESEDLVSLLRHLGKCRSLAKEYDLAEQDLKRSYALALKYYTESKPEEVIESTLAAGSFYVETRRFERAEKLLREAIELAEQVYGTNSGKLLPLLDELIYLLKYTARVDEALALELRYRAIECGRQ